MAGYPPPYPPPQGSPFGFDARTQARFARQQVKAQMRAQKMAFRAQRMAYKQQARAMRRSSILGPLLVVGIGVVLLLIRLDRLPLSTFTDWYARWWPLLFVAGGIILAIEWAFDHHSTQGGVPFVRRGVGGGVVLLLIALALFGSAISTFRMHPVFAGWHVDPDDLGEFFGERHEYQQEIVQPFPKGTTLNVQNPHGDVTIVGKSDDNKIHVVVNKQVYGWNEEDASGRADRLSPRVDLFGDVLSVTVPTLDAASSDLAITIPDVGQTTVNVSHGDVTISDLHAPVTITSNRGDIELNRIAGAVTAHVNNNSSSFTAHDIQGDVNLRGHADDLNLTNITGAVSLDGEFWGDTHLEHLAGPVTFHTNRTQFSVAKLDGMVDISSDDEMTGSQLVGPTELRTRSRNISFERVAGSVNISNSNGTVDLTDAAPLGNVSVENTNGAITLTVPEHAGLELQAQTREGAIQDDLDNTSLPSDRVVSHSTTIGNGAAQVTLHTTHADIVVHKAEVEPPALGAPDAPPAPPSTPEKPATPKRHTLTQKPDDKQAKVI
jgi:DUF4097 and DUF4098 domain-containing protein YvlB